MSASACAAALAIATNGFPLDAAPEWVPLLPAGPVIRGEDGREWLLPDAQALIAEHQRRGRDLVLDWEHASERPHERSPAAAWIEALEVRADGTLWGRARWTPQGNADVRSGAYRYISPVFLFDKNTRRIMAIRGAGLVHEPNLPLKALNRAEPPESKHMDLSKVCAALGLVDGANEEQILGAVAKLKTDIETATNKAEKPDLEKYVPRADYDQVMQRATNAEQQLQTLKGQALAAEVDALIDQAQKDGKIAPASAEFYRATCKTADGLDQFKKFVAAAPKIVAPGGNGPAAPPPAADGKLSDEERAICRQMGLSEADFLKSKEADR